MSRPIVTAMLLRPAVLAGAAALLTAAVVTAGKADRWPYSLVALAGVVGLIESNLWVYRLLRSPAISQGTGRYLQVCALWVVNLVTNLSLLNVAANLAFPGTFRGGTGPVTILDLLYFTVLTFATGGYGDIVPVTPAGKALAMLTTLFGFFFSSALCAAILQQITAKRS